MKVWNRFDDANFKINLKSFKAFICINNREIGTIFECSLSICPINISIWYRQIRRFARRRERPFCFGKIPRPIKQARP